MSEDREIMHAVWDGKLPVCVHMASDESATNVAHTEPFYVMVPRMSYFPIVLDKVKRHFLRSITPEQQSAEMWLDSNGTPLKWHYPIGVLYDLYGANSLPWTLTAHFSKFPESLLLHCPSRDAVESHFMSMLKEADVLKHREAVIPTMQIKDHNQLWKGLENDRFDQFWSVNRSLMKKGDDGFFKYIPVRIYLTQDEGTWIQKIVTSCDEDKKPMTLSHLINNTSHIKSEDDVLLHGIKLPMETPLQWLSEHMAYQDNFIHLTVIQHTDTDT